MITVTGLSRPSGEGLDSGELEQLECAILLKAWLLGKPGIGICKGYCRGTDSLRLLYISKKECGGRSKELEKSTDEPPGSKGLSKLIGSAPACAWRGKGRGNSPPDAPCR